jgi:hypothetical protein
MSRDSFEFDPESHRYRLNGVGIPGISFVLENTGFVDKTWFRPEHADRGHAVHAACLYLIQGDLDWGTVHPDILPRVKGFEEFWRGMQPLIPVVLLAEKPLYSTVYQFAGTPDLVIETRVGVKVIDIKTGKAGLAAKLQTAAQSVLVEERLGVKVGERYALELPEEGGYRLVKHDDRGDKTMFLNGLAMVNRRINEKELSL